MFSPQAAVHHSDKAVDVSVKRPRSPIPDSRQVRSRPESENSSSAIEAGRLAIGSALSGPWYYDIMDYAEISRKDINNQIQRSRIDVQQGDLRSVKSTVVRLAGLHLCKELESFVESLPKSEEVTNSLSLALTHSVDMAETGMVGYLLALGADPLCDTDFGSAHDLARLFADDSPDRAKIFAIIENGLKTKTWR